MAQSHIEHLDPGSLRPWAKNARTHSKKQLRQIAKSIETAGTSGFDPSTTALIELAMVNAE